MSASTPAIGAWQPNVNIGAWQAGNVFTTDFSEYTIGVAPSDWTDYWSSGNFTIDIEANSESYEVGTKQLSADTGTDGKWTYTWDLVGVVEDVQLIAKFSPFAGNSLIRFFARVSGTLGAENGYYVFISYTEIVISKYVNGVFTSLSTVSFDINHEVDYYLKFYCVGSDLKVKLWNRNAIEPYAWIIETTDSDLTSGSVGIGGNSTEHIFTVDYFSCGVGVGSPVFPPETLEDSLDFFGYASGDVNESASINVTRALGGYFVESNKRLTGLHLYHGGDTGTIRAAIYQGDSPTDLTGAELLYDFGQINVDTTTPILPTCDTPVTLTPEKYIWLILKIGSVTLLYFTEKGNAGNWQSARGRNDITAGLGYDTTVAFPDTIPSISNSFSDYWYSVGFYFEDASTPIEEPTPIFNVNQIVTEVLTQGNPKLQNNQTVAEVLTNGNPKLLANQIVVEVIETVPSKTIQNQQLVSEVIVTNAPVIQNLQSIAEVVITNAPVIQNQQAVIEVLATTVREYLQAQQVVTEVAVTDAGELQTQQVVTEIAVTGEGKLQTQQAVLEVAVSNVDDFIPVNYYTLLMQGGENV